MKKSITPAYSSTPVLTGFRAVFGASEPPRLSGCQDRLKIQLFSKIGGGYRYHTPLGKKEKSDKSTRSTTPVPDRLCAIFGFVAQTQQAWHGQDRLQPIFRNAKRPQGIFAPAAAALLTGRKVSPAARSRNQTGSQPPSRPRLTACCQSRSCSPAPSLRHSRSGHR